MVVVHTTTAKNCFHFRRLNLRRASSYLGTQILVKAVATLGGLLRMLEIPSDGDEKIVDGALLIELQMLDW
jgi:hypothetical protein